MIDELNEIAERVAADAVPGFQIRDGEQLRPVTNLEMHAFTVARRCGQLYYQEVLDKLGKWLDEQTTSKED